MNKTISIFILLAAMLTSCGHNTDTAPSKPVISSEIVTEEITSESPSEAVTTAVSSTTSMPTTTSTQSTTAVSTYSSTAEEKETEITETSAETKVTETSTTESNIPTTTSTAVNTTTVKNTETHQKSTSQIQTVTTAKATTTTVRTEPVTEPLTEAETEPKVALKHDGTDYGKAKAVYDYMVVHGTGTCVNYACKTYDLCKEIDLPCYIVWTDAGINGHTANIVEISGIWYVLDTQGGFFLEYNYGFTEVVDMEENHIADASIISDVSYEENI